MSALALTLRLPLLGWGAFYAAIAASWAGLIWLSGGPLDLLAQCLISPADLGPASLFVMWALMSLGMMLPTAFPALQRFAVLAQARQDGLALARFIAFIAAYALVWLGFSVLAVVLQLILTRASWLLDGRSANLWLAAALLGFAGLYQFSRLKHACLTRCRHPMTFFMAHWRDGIDGAFQMGLKHGRDCLGCCWALMSLAFIGGAMNIGWMSLAMVLMLVEKLAGPGRYVTLPLGLILVSAAGFTLGSAWQTL